MRSSGGPSRLRTRFLMQGRFSPMALFPRPIRLSNQRRCSDRIFHRLVCRQCAIGLPIIESRTLGHVGFLAWANGLTNEHSQSVPTSLFIFVPASMLTAYGEFPLEWIGQSPVVEEITLPISCIITPSRTEYASFLDGLFFDHWPLSPPLDFTLLRIMYLPPPSPESPGLKKEEGKGHNR